MILENSVLFALQHTRRSRNHYYYELGFLFIWVYNAHTHWKRNNAWGSSEQSWTGEYLLKCKRQFSSWTLDPIFSHAMLDNFTAVSTVAWLGSVRPQSSVRYRPRFTFIPLRFIAFSPFCSFVVLLFRLFAFSFLFRFLAFSLFHFFLLYCYFG